MNQKKSKGLKRTSIQLSKKAAEEYRNNLETFNRIFEEEQASFHHSNESLYFLVSTLYIEQWREFCSSSEKERLEPIPMNQDLFDEDGKKLREGLAEGADLEIFNSKIYKLVKMDGGIQLARRSYLRGNEKKVPLYTKPLKYIIFINKDLKDIDFKRKFLNDFAIKQLTSISEEATIKNFILEIRRLEKLSLSLKARAWKNPESFTLQRLFKDIVEKCRPIHQDYRIRGNGILQDNENTIEDSKYEEGDYFIIEVIDELSDWFFREANQKKCEGCYKLKKLPFECGCKRVAYCSESCQQNDKRYHLRTCSFAEEQELNKPIDMNMTDRSLQGVVGLSNLGNTCFMNSCLQCLSHTLPLTEYFLKSLYEGEINKDNPLGTKGKLAKSYAKFICNMWCRQQRTFSPHNLKLAVSTVNQMFSGYAQHDSQEFLTFLVDGIHEDLNRVKKKPYVENVESNERPDEVVAKESWIAHTKRNQSIIVDLMTGQYKSKVVCPDCKKQSITFDPFTTVTLPIPEESSPGILKYYILFHNNLEPTKKMSFMYKKSSPEQWTIKAAEIIKKPKQNFRFYVLTMYEDIYSFQNTGKSQIINKIQVQNKSVFLIELSEAEKNFKQPVELVFSFCKKGYYGDDYDILWFKRPFWFEKEGTNGQTITKRILEYLYNDTYDESKKRGRTYSKTLDEYMQYMMKSRPFKLAFKFKKSAEFYYHRREVKFAEEVEIRDETKLSELLQKAAQNDCEIDVRFNRDGYRDYSFERLKKYEDCTEQISRKVQNVTVNLQQCFEVLEYPEKLQKGNEWYCPSCKDHKLATKQMTVYKAPTVLVLHLKRFKSKGQYRKQKNEANVIFPHCLDLTPYVIDPTPMASYTESLKEEGHFISPPADFDNERLSTAPIYDLYAISNHYGGLGGGHYTAYAKNKNSWYDFNDSSVHEISENGFRGSGAYMLFYKRRLARQK